MAEQESGKEQNKPLGGGGEVGRKLERATLSGDFKPPSLEGVKRPPPVLHQFPRKDQKTKNPRKVRGGLKVSSLDEASGSWAGQRWLRLVELGATGAAQADGLEYAKLGQTRRIEIGAGRVSALVQGRLPKAYRTTLDLPTYAREQWDRVVEAMIEQALYSAKLLAGEVPSSIEDVFAPLGLRLFPAEPTEHLPGEVTPSCTCDEPRSDEHPWCKHACCVAMLVANELAGDPWLIFRLRGMEKQELLDRLRHHRTISVSVGGAAPVYEPQVPALEDVADESLESCLNHFWTAGSSAKHLSLAADPPEVTHPLLRRLGASPFEEGSFPIVGLFATCYDLVTRDTIENTEIDESLLDDSAAGLDAGSGAGSGDQASPEPVADADSGSGGSPSPAERRRAATKPKKIGKAKARKPGTE